MGHRRRTATVSLPAGRSAFRPEVQALRAVAVGSVVLFHLWPDAVPGGFVGVDVFFVISGFLITQHLAAELSRTGRVALGGFWARRVRRILPAALTVLAASVALVVLFMPRLTWQQNLSEIRAAAAYAENWLLGAHAVDYLAAENTPSIVQHYWSLSVEEQFYLLWPLLLLLTVPVARRSRTRLRPALVAVLGVAGIASFVVSVTWTHADPAMAFFATPTRAWEFAVGGLVGVLLPAGGLPGLHGRAALSWAGLAGVGSSLFVISRADAFPGAIAALPVLSAATVIAAGTSTARWSPRRVMELPAVQWLGDNSYSTYLWHWPLLIVAPWITHGPVGWAPKCVVLVATLALAAITKRLVEDPVRQGEWWRHRRWPAFAFAVAGVGAVVLVSSGITGEVVQDHRQVSAAVRAQETALVASHHRSCFGAAAMLPVNRCSRPFARPRHLDTEFAATDGKNDPCLQNFDAATPAWCVLGRRSTPTRTIAIVGNSHAWRLVPALALYGERHGWRVLVASRINCLGLITAPVTPAGGATPNCLHWSRLVLHRLTTMPRLDAVVFPAYRYADEFLEGMHAPAAAVQATKASILATWRQLAARGTRVIVPGDVPGMRPTLDPECIAQSRARYDPCAVDRRSVDGPSLTATLAAQHPDLATEIPLTRYFCDAQKCHGLIGGVVVYFDSHHLTGTFSRSLARYLGAAVEAALPPLRTSTRAGAGSRAIGSAPRSRAGPARNG